MINGSMLWRVILFRILINYYKPVMIFCGIEISLTKKEQLFLNFKEFRHLIPLNAEGFVMANKDERLMQILNSNYTTIDGQIPLWLYKLKYSK